MKTFVILGMHRSATSLVAKGMDNVIHLGDEEDMLPPAPDNPQGFYENKKFIELNDEILFAAGGNWLEPPAHEKILEVESRFEKPIKTLLREESYASDIWGWKDPRTTLTIELYHKHLENPHYIACFRDPIQVAESLNKRNGYSLQKGLTCALEYNYRLIRFLSEKHLKMPKHE